MIRKSLSDYTGLLVYHGSDRLVDSPDLSWAKRRKDFGAGFYTTSNRMQARKFAKIVCNRSQKATPVVSAYRIGSLEGLRVKIFAESDPPDMEWLDLVVKCRSTKGYQHRYDIVIGPIADDQTAIVIQALMAGAYGDPASAKAKETAISFMESQNLQDQIVFCTVKALERIVFQGAVK